MCIADHDRKRRSVSLFLVGLMVALLLSACQPVRPESEWVTEDAADAEAVEAPAQADETNRAEAQAYVDKGATLFESGDFQQAVTNFDKAIELEPNWADPYLGRGIVQFESMLIHNNYDQVIPVKHDFDKAIELDPDLVEAYCLRGRIHFMLVGSFFLFYPAILEQGVADYRMVLELAPDDPCREEAEQFLELSNEIDLEELRQTIAGPIADATIAIEQNPTDLAAYWTRATFYAAMGDGEQAIRDLKTLIEIGIESDSLSPEQLEVLEQVERNVDEGFDPLPFVLLYPGLDE